MKYYNSFHIIGENSEKRTVSKGYDTLEEAKAGIEHRKQIDKKYNESFQYSIAQTIKEQA
jgi:hypothetical protein